MSEQSIKELSIVALMDTESPTTKDCAHTKTNGGYTGAEVHFGESMVLQTKKDKCLSYSK